MAPQEKQSRFLTSSIPTDPLVERFYKGFSQSFVLPNETEDLEAFQNCLALNEAPLYAPLERTFGPFRELVSVFEEEDDSVLRDKGGANFICLRHEHVKGFSSPVITAHLNYIYVLKAFRRQGLLKRMIDSIFKVAAECMMQKGAEASRVFIIYEQNDPYRISKEDAELDTRFAAITQCDRVRIWTQTGAKFIDFPYVQPPLSHDKAAEENLVLGILGLKDKEKALPADLLYQHLKKFFGLSVFKGKDPHHNAVAAHQLHELERAASENRSFAVLTYDGTPHPESKNFLASLRAPRL